MKKMLNLLFVLCWPEKNTPQVVRNFQILRKKYTEDMTAVSSVVAVALFDDIMHIKITRVKKYF